MDTTVEKELWKGNEAVAEAAIRAGCKCFFGYPITPQNEIPEYMSAHLPEAGGVFIQSESELAAINMVYGAAASGVRAMTSSSSPGISLKQEGISAMCSGELPGVVVNMMRGGPGLGTIQPSQCDYFQATRGGGNGDYRTIVLAPCDIQEAVDMTQEAFDLADIYRMPVVILGDGMIGQMMEPIEWHDIPKRELPPKDWTASGRKGRDHSNFVTSLRIDAADCEQFNLSLEAKYKTIAEKETRWAEQDTEDCEILVVAYGTPSRIALSAVEELEAKGIKAGLFRPRTVWPFPSERLAQIAAQPGLKAILVVEMSLGQMLEDVQLAVKGAKPVRFYGRVGGMIPSVEEIAEEAEKILREVQ